jgi:hypothetical protein
VAFLDGQKHSTHSKISTALIEETDQQFASETDERESSVGDVFCFQELNTLASADRDIIRPGGGLARIEFVHQRLTQAQANRLFVVDRPNQFPGNLSCRDTRCRSSGMLLCSDSN